MDRLLKYRFNKKDNSNNGNENLNGSQSPIFDQKLVSSESLFDSPIIESKKINSQIVSVGSSPWFSKNVDRDSEFQESSLYLESCQSTSDLGSQNDDVICQEDILKLHEIFPELSQSSIINVLNENDNIVENAVNQILSNFNKVQSRKRSNSSESIETLPMVKRKCIVYSSDESTPQKNLNNYFKDSRHETDKDNKPLETNLNLFQREINFKSENPALVKNFYQRTNVLKEKKKEDERVLKFKNNFDENEHSINDLERVSQTENAGSMKSIFASRAQNKLLPVQIPHLKDKKTENKKFKNIICHDSDLDDDDSNTYSKPEKDDIKLTSDLILKFFNTATEDELTFIDGCSLKKAEVIVSLRPFEDINNFNDRLEEARLNPSTFVNQCKDLLKLRHSIQTLMERCEKISQDLEERVNLFIDNNGSDEIKDNLVKQPALLNDRMKLAPYQLIGLNWLILMHRQHINGILGDEMGLGKTIQIISFLAYLLSNGNRGPHVIIAPSSTIDNWLRELKIWCPALKVLLYYGSQEERREIRNSIVDGEIEEYHIILTSYTMAAGSSEDRVLFKKFSYEYSIFDEGHMLKNMTSLRYQNLMKISSKRRLLLTGTPLQNNLLELMSLLSFIMPEIFSGKTENFKKIFTSSGSKSNDIRGSYEKETLEHAKRILKPFFLRRLKSQVLNQLPSKTIMTLKVNMTTEQAKLYNRLKLKFTEDIQHSRLQKEADSENIKLKKAKKKSYGEGKINDVLKCSINNENGVSSITSQSGSAMMMQLRKAANHKLLHRELYDDTCLEKMAKLLKKDPSHNTANVDYILEDMQIMSDFELHSLCMKHQCLNKFILDDSSILDSGKFNELDRMLPKFQQENGRVLLFSQFTMVLDIIEEYMRIRKHKYLRLDGQTVVAERQELIDEFNTNKGIFVFLLSTKAGGLGINLTSANIVLIHDIDFNPYNDKQAEDRCHRVGQTRDVFIYRLISEDTIEEAMLKCATNKLKLESEVTGIENGSKEDANTDVASLLNEALQI